MQGTWTDQKKNHFKFLDYKQQAEWALVRYKIIVTWLSGLADVFDFQKFIFYIYPKL